MAVGMTHLFEGRSSLSERVYLSIREAILSLALPPGARIDKKLLAKDLGVSLFPVSDAITRLSVDGIVDVYPQAGTYVAPFSMAEIREGAFLREALECTAVERIAAQATEQQIAELRRNLRLQEVLSLEGDSEGFFELDEEMHEILIGATGFSKLAVLTETLWLHVERARRLFARTPGSARIAFEEHRIIVDAISDGNPEKARAGMKKHVQRVAQELYQLEEIYPDYFRDEKANRAPRASK